MSDSKRATLITVGAPKSAKKNVNKTVRLTINLVESNESKYPELNYKELVIAEERKKKVENGKTRGLDPYSDNDDDVKQVARKFEQKYGGKSTYGHTGRSKQDDFADIGAGYDENDSFIDNTDGYDEMIPPECDTFYGGFYINSGSLEFKTVPDNQALSDAEPRRNKRRISSSSSEDDSSESSSSSSQDEKEPKPVVNGDVDSHKTAHRKKKNKKIDKKKAKKIRRTDSSAATSGKQTSDDNVHGDGESVDSRTSHSDSLASKPRGSETAATSDSSRDVEPKTEVKLPPPVLQLLEELEAAVGRQPADGPSLSAKELEARGDQHIGRLERLLSKCSAEPAIVRAAWARAARCLHTPRAKLLQRARAIATPKPSTAVAQPTAAPVNNNKRKAQADVESFSRLSAEEIEEEIVDTLQRLKALIEERKPAMIGSYNAECERVREERKKMKIAKPEGAPHIEKRMPKRRFPWCPRARALLLRLTRLAGAEEQAAQLLARRALPLFPNGFVRMPTLLRQADLSKEVKVPTDVKRQRIGSASQLPVPSPLQPPQPPQVPPQSPLTPQPPAPFAEPIHFPSSLTVTTCARTDKEEDKYKNTALGTVLNSFSLNKDTEKPDEKTDNSKEDMYIPPNIGSITITPVPNNKDKKLNTVIASTEKHKEGLIRVKSPAALNEMVKKDKEKSKSKTEKNHIKEKRIDTPLHIDTSSQPAKKELSPMSKEEAAISQKQIESMRISENNIPRPALVPVHHSPTFAKPDKRPPEPKKKKDVVIMSDVDPLADAQPEPFAIDDSSSDVEVIEDKTDKSGPKSDNSEVPSKDKVSDKKVNSAKQCKPAAVATAVTTIKDGKSEKRSDSLDEPTKEDIDTIMRNIREMEHSQEPTKLSTTSYGGVITSAKHEKSSSQPLYNARNSLFEKTRSDKDKFAERASLNKMDGYSAITG